MAESHGYSRTRIYRIYSGMKQRCYNPNCLKYPRYGARGIYICDEWLGSDGFLNFLNWSYSHGYNDSLTIDRLDSTGNYSPSNCRWATYGEQNSHLAMLKTNKSGVVGVSWSNKENKWVCVISIHNKSKRIGCFDTIREAAEARNRFIIKNNLLNQLSLVPMGAEE